MESLINELGDSASAFGRQAFHQVRTNIMPRVEQELRQNIVPVLERKGKEIKERWNDEQHPQRRGVKRSRRRPRPPSSTDIVYLTERFLVSSKPAPDHSNTNGPTYLDVGRDISSDVAQSQKKHDRILRQRRFRQSGRSESIQENLEKPGTHEPNKSSIPEEEDHNNHIGGNHNHDRLRSKDEDAKLLENPQDGAATQSSAKNLSVDETRIAEQAAGNIRGQDSVAQSPGRKPSVSPSSINATDVSHHVETPLRTSIHHSSFHSSTTDVIVNHKDVTDHSSTATPSTPKTSYAEAATPLTKNAVRRDIPNLDGNGDESSDGPPLMPNMPLLPPRQLASDFQSGIGIEDGDTSVASFATCKDDDPFDTTPEHHESLTEPTAKTAQHSSISSPPPIPPSIINSPGSMVTYLDKAHGRENYLAFSLAKEKPDDRTLLLFRRQIIPMGMGKSNGSQSTSHWSPCCVERSETPSISHVLKICYAIHAFLNLDPSNVVLTYCDNGKTRTGIVAACYLKFSNFVEKTQDGFQYFLSTLRRHQKLLLEREKKRRKKMGALFTAAMDAIMDDDYDNDGYDWRNNDDAVVDNIMRQLPPSLNLFFEQFDRALHSGGFLNRKPLLLRAIMLQGVPVEDQPCIDIWDSSQKHVYSSHPPVTLSNPRNNVKPISQWVDEEGFYRINVVLDGEFLILCRFGGDSAQISKEQNIHDPSKILFRYTNTTGFMSGGCPYELSSKKVDLMRLYADHLDDEEFLLTILFEADWEHIEDDNYNVDTSVSSASWKRLRSASEVCSERIWRSHEEQARDEGWRVIFENHCAQPTAVDMEKFRRVHRHSSAHGSPDFESCPDHLIGLSLQLTNYDFRRAAALLLRSPVFSWWQEEEDISSLAQALSSRETSIDTDSERRDFPLGVKTELDFCDEEKKRSFSEIEDAAKQNILDILDSVDATPNLDPHDQNYLKQLKTSSPSQSFKKSKNEEPVSSPPGSDSSRDPQESLSSLCLKDTGYLIPSIIYPHRGDIARSFSMHETSRSPERHNDISSSLQCLGNRKSSISNLRIPYFSSDKPKPLPIPSHHMCMANHLFDDKCHDLQVPVYDFQLETAKELHWQLRHTGITLSMLLELQQASQEWTGGALQSREILDNSVIADTVASTEIESVPNTGELVLSMNREEKGKKEKEWQDAQKAEAEERQKAREQGKSTEEATEKQIKEATVEETKVEAKVGNAEKEVPLKDDPEYGKYFKMLKLGMPKEQVLHAFQRDGKDPKILDLDPNQSLESQLASNGEDEQNEIPLKDDPEYGKYFKMLKLGMPKEQVLHAFQRDGKDPKILDLDPNQSLDSQIKSSNAENEQDLPLEDDPEYTKYFKMLKLGMPKEQVLHALKRDDKNPNILNLDPKKSLKSQEEKSNENGDGTPLKDDPEYSKYFKMIKMGMPKEQVLHAVKRDGKDPKILDLDPNKSLKSQQKDDGVPLKDDPIYAKYFKMEQVGLPRDAVKNALIRDGKDPSIIDLDPLKSLKAQIGGELEEKDTGIPMKDDPEYAKYFKMEKMGMPKGVVRNALVRDGKDPAIADFDPNMSAAFQLKQLKTSSSEKPIPKRKKKKKIKRKKIYWNPIDPNKIKDDSLWNIVRDNIAMGNLEYDQKEFEELFTESVEAGVQNKKKLGQAKKEAKKAVQAIDPKRSMNGGIVLSTIKTDHKTIADFVDKMDHTKFDAIQLGNLKEYLATSEERVALEAYMRKAAESEEKKEELFKDLSETEKYMVTLMQVPDAGAKLHTMEFRSGFKNRFSDITSGVRTLNAACDELRSSEKFRKLMAMILTVVNQINTGGEGNLAMGFTLDALLKLNEAKAFDKKTSVLHYVVKLVMKNDESLLYFENDLGHVIPAESVLLDALTGDVKKLQSELSDVIKIVTKDADRIEQSGDTTQLTLAELVEQKSIVQHLGETPHQVGSSSRLSGRTPMERFSMNAKVACEQALEAINSLQTKYVLVLSYFGEDEQMPTGDFFGTLRRFMSEWKKATKQVEKIERRKAKERRREAKKAAKAKKKARGLKGLSRKKENNNEANTPPTIGGIAALAAQAALKKAQPREPEQEMTDTSQKPPVVGIAALAAQAALKKAQPREPEQEMTDTAQKPPVVGIAALAAQAALKKKEKISEDASLQPPVVGIAALAAQAALKKSQPHEAEQAIIETEPETQPLADETAAQAVTKQPMLKKEPLPVDNITSQSAKSMSIGEMAELAAKAAVEITQMQHSKAQSQQVLEGPDNIVETKKATRDGEEQGLKGSESPTDEYGTIVTKTPFEESLQHQADSEVTPKRSPQNGVPLLSPNAEKAPLISSREKLAEQSLNGEDTQQLSGSEVSALHTNGVKQSPRQNPPMTPPPAQKSPLSSKVDFEKTPEQLLEDLTLQMSPVIGSSSPAAEATSEEARNHTTQEKELDAPPTADSTSLNPESQEEKIASQSPQEKLLDLSTEAESSCVSVEATQDKTQNQSQEDNNALNLSSGAEKVSLPTAEEDEKIAIQLPQEKMVYESPETKNSAVPTEGTEEKTPKQSPEEQALDLLTSLVAQIEKAKKESPQRKSPQHSSPQRNSPQRLSPQRLSPQRPSPQRSPAFASTSLSLALGRANMPSPNRKSPNRSPRPLIPSLSAVLENAKQDDTRKSNGPSLGSFFDQQNRQNVRNEILRQNYDDSSVAKMAENLQKDQMNGAAWNQGGGIADYMSWANQAIRISDTDSVRDFENARDILYDDQSTVFTGMTGMDDSTHAPNMDDSTHATNFDDGTIATNFDDDASIGTAMATPSNELGHGGEQDYYNSGQYDNYVGSADDPYTYNMAADGTQNPYGEAVINVPLEFTQDQGINNALSFGDEGFDGPGEYGTNDMMGGGDAYGEGLVGFGQNPGLGGFGMTSPTTLGNSLNNFASPAIPGPPLVGGSAQRPWGATPANQSTHNDEERNRPWSAGPNISKNAETGNIPQKEEGVVFRGWGDVPKTPEQPKRKNWFWN